MSRNKDVKCYNNFISQLLPMLGNEYSVKNKDGGRYQYVAYMLDRTQNMFEWSGLPDTIPARMLELLLQVNGYAGIAPADNGKLYAFFGGLGGVPDEYYMPTEFIVNNPALNFNATLKINEDCVIIRNDDMYIGLMPMYNKYAELLTENDITFRVMSINSRLASVISAADDSTKDAAKEYLKDIESGKLGVIGESAFFDGVRVQAGAEATANRIIDLIEYNQYLKASWYNEIGIQAAFNMKREALNSDEVQLNIKALLPLAENMLKCRQEAADRINAMFKTNITVDFKSVWKDTQEEVKSIDQLDGAPEEKEEQTEEKTDEETETN